MRDKKHWFDIDIEWLEGNFSAREPQFYKKLFQRNIEDKSDQNILYFLFLL